ncbi:hypothetical protein [Gilvimarinus japonicus]|uniref:Uncharacterized protein n=1 Tax=Gilvimarinus japonicus TaxID=1796469 RepID=A0ABV7HZM7_9GAMM
MKLFGSSEKVASTPFSDFIRNASSREKKRVYSDVLKKATERQQAQLKRAAELRKAREEISSPTSI